MERYCAPCRCDGPGHRPRGGARTASAPVQVGLHAAVGPELTLGMGQRARCAGIGRRDGHCLATASAWQAHGTHQPFPGATRQRNTLVVEMQPDLVSGPQTCQLACQARWMSAFKPSSRTARARGSSLFLRSSRSRRLRSLLLRPSRVLASTSWRLTHSSSVDGTQPILGQSIPQPPTARGTRCGAPAPSERRARAPRVKTSMPCSWLHFLKSRSLLKTRGQALFASLAIFVVVDGG